MVGDNEEHMLATLSLVLRRAGFKVTASGNGEDLLSRIVELASGPELVDLVLVDFQLSGLNGVELAMELGQRKIRWPVLLMTGFSDKRMVAEAMRRGCVGCLEKPFEPEQLLSRVRWAIEKTRQLGDKEEAMLALSENSGLCDTCNHSVDCAYRTRAHRAVVHCEEFDAYQVPCVPREFPRLVEIADFEAEESGRYTGLCINCDFRQGCLNSCCEHGVWHCENYQ